MKEELEQKFETLYKYVTENPDVELKMIDKAGDFIVATFDTAYESDNGLEMEEEGYEEYNAIAFCEKTTGKLFEIAYFNIPAEVWHDSKQII